MPSLTEVYERNQNRVVTSTVLVEGIPVAHRNMTWGNEGFGTVPTAQFDAFRPLPASLVEGARVEIYAGFDGATTIQFRGTIENVQRATIIPTIECSGMSRILKLTYRSQVIVFSSVTAVAAVTQLLVAAGLVDYFVNLDAWTIGVNVPGEIDFTTYGDAINVIARVDGSPFYEMPNGQVRVEKRDPIPGSSVFRSYYSGVLSQLTTANRQALAAGTLPLTAIQPPTITDPLLQPRLRSFAIGSRFADVKNKIIAQGAVATSTGTGGQQVSQRLSVTALGPSPYIPTPPQYQEVTVDAPLVDDIDKVAAVAVREFALQNRLQKVGTAVVDGDPEMFLGATVFIADDDYTGETANYFVAGYRSSISDSDFVTELTVTGGTAAGSTPLLTPFACFQWGVGGKLNQVLPVGIGPGNIGVVITFDASCSKDFDGVIPSTGYAWSDSKGNSGSGIYFQAAYNPATTTSVDVTLTVTDADGLTDSVTKTVTVQGDDSNVGGQPTLPTYIFSAAEAYAMGSADGGVTWNDIPASALGFAGKFVACSAQHYTDGDEHGTVALFITDRGELMISVDNVANGFIPTSPNGSVLSGGFSPGTGFQAIPILGASTAAWLVLISSGAGFVLYYTANDNKPSTANAWNVQSVTNLNTDITIKRARQDYEADATWPANIAATRAIVF